MVEVIGRISEFGPTFWSKEVAPVIELFWIPVLCGDDDDDDDSLPLYGGGVERPPAMRPIAWGEPDQ